MEANTNDDGEFFFDDSYIEVGGLTVGYIYNYFDIGLPGETFLSDDGPIAGADYIGGDTLNNSIRYWDFSEWSIGAEYAIAVSEKFTIAPGVQYWDGFLRLQRSF